MKKALLAFICSAALLWPQSASYPSSVVTDAQLKVAKNMVRTTLRGSISAADTVITVANPTGIVANSLLTIDSEILNVTGVSGNNLTVARGFDGTTAAAHTTGRSVSAFIAAWHHNAMAAEVKAIQTALGPNLSAVNPSTPTTFLSTSYNFAAQSPGGSLSVGTNSVTLTPCPQGVAGTDTNHYLYVSGGTGTAEPVLITGGTCTSGAATGTVFITAANTHSGAWTIGSATAGVQEALNRAILAGSQRHVFIPAGSYNFYQAVNLNGLSDITIEGAGPATIINANLASGATGSLFTSTVAQPSVTTDVAASINTNRALTVSNTISLTSATGFAAGDYVRFVDSYTGDSYLGAGTQVYSFQQISRIKTLVTTTLTPDEPVSIPMVTTHTTKSISKITLASGIRIANMTMDGTGGQPATTNRGIYLQYLLDSSFQNLTISNFTGTGTSSAGFHVQLAYKVSVSNLTTYRCGSSLVSGQMVTDFSVLSLSNLRGIQDYWGMQWAFGVYLQAVNLSSIGATNGRAIKLQGVGWSSLSNIEASGSLTGTGLSLTVGTWRCNVENVIANNNKDQGVWFSGTDDVYNVITNVHVSGNGLSAGSYYGLDFFVTDTNNVVSNFFGPDGFRQGTFGDNILTAAFSARALVGLVAAQSLTTATDTALLFDFESYDFGAIHSNTTNKSRLTVPANLGLLTGVGSPAATFIKLTAHVTFTGAATGYRQISIKKNGTALAYKIYPSPSTATNSILELTVEDMGTAGDYYEVFAYQNSGAALDVQNSTVNTYFTMIAGI